MRKIKNKIKKIIFGLIAITIVLPSMIAEASGTNFIQNVPVNVFGSNSSTTCQTTLPGGTPFHINSLAATDTSITSSVSIGGLGCLVISFGTIKNVTGFQVRTSGTETTTYTLRLYNQSGNVIGTQSRSVTSSATSGVVSFTGINAFHASLTSTSAANIIDLQIFESPDTTPPAVPTGVTAVGGNMSIALSWQRPPDIDLAGYRIFRNGVQVATVNIPSTSTTLTNLTPLQSYTIGVAAVDVWGNVSAQGTATATVIDTTAPTNPTTLQAFPNDNQVYLQWNAATDNHQVEGYRIFQNGTLIQTVTTTNAYISGLFNNIQYTFTVRAFDPSGNVSSGVSVNAIPKDTTPPFQPDPSFDNLTETSVRLFWSFSNSVDIDFYEVRKGTEPVIVVDHEGNVEHDHTFINLVSGVTYSLQVRAVDDDGVRSLYKAVQVTTLIDAPAVPTGLKVTPLDNENKIEWNDNTESDLAGYRIYLQGSNTPIGNVGKVKIFNHTGLNNLVEKCYQITAFDGFNNESLKSSPVCGTPKDIFPPFDVPTVTVTNVMEYSLTLNWQPSTSIDVEFYKLYKNTSFITQVNASTLTYNVTGLTPGVTNSFSVNPVDDDGNETQAGSSGTITAMTYADPPDAPTGLTAAPAPGEIVLSWTEPSDTDLKEYKIYLVNGTTYTLLDVKNESTLTYTFSSTDTTAKTFAVSAVDEGLSESPKSATVTAAIIPLTPPPPPPIFDGVTSPISASDIVETSLSLVNVLKWFLLISLAFIVMYYFIRSIRQSMQKRKNGKLKREV